MLNSILKGQKTIESLVFNKNEYVGDHAKAGGVIFDLLCTDQDGSQFLIEVQRSNQKNLKQRMLYYACKLMADQAPKGKRDQWNYLLTEIYTIVFVDGFVVFNNRLGFYHSISLRHNDDDELFDTKLNFIYVELDRYQKNINEIKTDLDGWLYILKNISKLNDLPDSLRKLEFEKVFDLAEFTKLTKKEQQMYDSDLKRKWDAQNIIDFAMEEGLQKGLEEGRQKGRQEGYAELNEKNVRHLILNFSFSDKEIEAILTVSLDFITYVREKMKTEKK